VEALKIAIIGGGIGGLSAAIALRKLGYAPVVYERALGLSEVGQGLGLFANAVRALDWLGVGDEVRNVGWRFEKARTYSATGRLLVATDPIQEERRSGIPSLLIMRTRLQEILFSALPQSSIQFGAHLDTVVEQYDGVRLAFKGGESETVDIVIGADGWSSAVAKSQFKIPPPRYSGLICWRGLASGDVLKESLELPIVQGRGPQMGIGPLSANTCYWFVAFPGPADSGPTSATQAKASLEEMVRTFPFAAREIVATTDPDNMLRTDLYDRDAIDCWSKGHITLLGDAAHPMLPTLGQGAAMAIEDAVVLARKIAAHGVSVEKALVAYQNVRKPRTDVVVSNARMLGRLGKITNHALVGLRDVSARMTPSFVTDRTAKTILSYDSTSV